MSIDRFCCIAIAAMHNFLIFLRGNARNGLEGALGRVMRGDAICKKCGKKISLGEEHQC